MDNWFIDKMHGSPKGESFIYMISNLYIGILKYHNQSNRPRIRNAQLKN